MNILRRVRKLSTMPAGEVTARASYWARLKAERVAHARGWLARPDRLRKAVGGRADWFEHLHGRVAHAPLLLPSLRDPEAMRLAVERTDPSAASWRRRAGDAVRRGEIELFNTVCRLTLPVDWHGDPRSGRQWPRGYWADLPSASGDVGYGDVKDIWELHRQQYLLAPAVQAFLYREPDESALVFEVVDEWITHNPVATGMGWACALEPAYRVLTWSWIYGMCREGLGSAPDFHVKWIGSFYDHGWFLSRHLERFSSPYNHLIGESCALFLVGLLFPEFEDASSWERTGRALLEQRLADQFYPDGACVEQATCYHHATLACYLLAALAAEAHGRPLSDDVWAHLERAGEFSMWMTRPDGTTPVIGDNDDGRPLLIGSISPFDYRALLGALALRLSRPEFKHVAGPLAEDVLWLLGPRALRDYEALPSRAPGELVREFSYSGYRVSRTAWAGDADVVWFDCGEQAAGLRGDEVANAAHGHADALSVEVVFSGRPVLVDPGFYTYNGATEWEAYFRSTPAHNTLSVGGDSQADHLGKMAWAHCPTVEATGSVDHGAQRGVSWSGTHDGYARRGRGCTHGRSVWPRDGYVVVADRLDGPAGTPFALTWQCAPAVTAQSGDGGVVDLGGSHRGTIMWVASTDMRVRVSKGGDGPQDGWVSPSLGVRVPAPRVLLEGVVPPGAGAAILSVVSDESRVSVQRYRWPQAIADMDVAPDGLVVRNAGSVDLIAAATMCATSAPSIIIVSLLERAHGFEAQLKVHGHADESGPWADESLWLAGARCLGIL